MYITLPHWASDTPASPSLPSLLHQLTVYFHYLFCHYCQTKVHRRQQWKPQTYVLDVTCQFRTSFNRPLNCCSLCFFIFSPQPSKRHSILCFLFFKIVTIFVCTLTLFLSPLSLSTFSFSIIYLFYYICLNFSLFLSLYYRFKFFSFYWLGLFLFLSFFVWCFMLFAISGLFLPTLTHTHIVFT